MKKCATVWHWRGTVGMGGKGVDGEFRAGAWTSCGQSRQCKYVVQCGFRSFFFQSKQT